MPRIKIIDLLSKELEQKRATYTPEDFEQELELLQDTLKSAQKKAEIGLGSLVKMKMNGKEGAYFFAPTLGGTLLKYEEGALLVISIFSPLGAGLMGKKSGESFEFVKQGQKRLIEILTVD